MFCEKPMAQTVEGVKQCFRAAEDSGKKFRCDIKSSYNLCLLKGRLFSVLSTEGLTLPLETPTTRFAKVGIVLRIYFGSFFLLLRSFVFLCFSFVSLQVRLGRCSRCRASAGTPHCHQSPISGTSRCPC